MRQQGQKNSFAVDYEPVVELVDNFVGRKSEVGLIESYLRRKQSKRLTVVTLYGTGGIGKTQLASAYLNQPPHYHSARFHLDGSTRPNFDGDLLKIAKAIGLKDALAAQSETLIQMITDWLNLKGNDEWLILLDNVDDPGDGAEQFDVSNFLRRVRQGSIIITTRLRGLIPNSKLVVVERLEKMDALRVLRDHAHDEIAEGDVLYIQTMSCRYRSDLICRL